MFLMRARGGGRRSEKVVYHFPNPISSILHGRTRSNLLKMAWARFPQQLIVDIGCRKGGFTRHLTSIGLVVGLDVNKTAVFWAKKNVPDADFICADVCHLPIKNNSVDLVVGASILEFIENLECAVKQIQTVLGRHGMFVVGYPIETPLLKAGIELISRRSVRMWDPRRVMSEEEYRRSPDTHKQKYPAIRRMLSKYFRPLRKEKVPFTFLPDFLSIYECSMLAKAK